MSDINLPNWVDIAGILSLFALGIMTVFSKTVRQNVKDQSALIHTLEQKVSGLEDSQKNSEETIKKLQGELNVVKGLPLKTLAETQASIVKMQQQMLDILTEIQKEISKG